MLELVLSWHTAVIVLIVFGFAPRAVLRLIVLAFPRDDPRRQELLAEIHAVPRKDRPFWVIEQLEVALYEGVCGRIRRAVAAPRWYLSDGVERNHLYPTFEIPDEAERLAITPGDHVKLMFEMKNGTGEGMWVQVVEVGDGEFLGMLCNIPVFIPRLKLGDEIEFRPEHIIDIDDELALANARADENPSNLLVLCPRHNIRARRGVAESTER